MNRFSFCGLGLLPALLSASPTFAQDQVPTTTPAPRRGWSPQARDATIGGAAGLLGGLLLDGHNHKVGGLLGGLAGAGAGYVLGQHQANQRQAAAAAAAQQAAANEQAAAEAQAAAAQQAATRQPTAETAQATAANVQAATARVQAARVAATRAQAARRHAERQLAASQRAVTSQAQGVAPATADLAVAAGFLPNPTMGQDGTPYPFSAVLRKSW